MEVDENRSGVGYGILYLLSYFCGSHVFFYLLGHVILEVEMYMMEGSLGGLNDGRCEQRRKLRRIE